MLLIFGNLTLADMSQTIVFVVLAIVETNTLAIL